MRKYSVHKIFGPTIQGEGAMTGTVCHFIRLSGCNMWDGRPETRSASHCPFCDTDFFSHTMMTASEIIAQLAPLNRKGWVTVSGGEPALQLDQPLVDALHLAGYMVAVETNGTKALKSECDHLTVSPKLARNQTVIERCDTLKLLYPHPNPVIQPELFNDISATDKYLQPIDTGDDSENQLNIDKTIDKLYELEGWKLSLQTHKYLGVE
jgi:7-carboxy-7-deazaguanine synthase